MTFLKARWPSLVALVLLSIALTFCKKGPGDAPGSAPPPVEVSIETVSDLLDERQPGEVAVPGGSLIRSLETSVGTLNPVTAQSISEQYVYQWIYRQVLNLNERVEPIPGLAESWEISDDRLTYTFLLRPDATWADGARVTTADFAFTIDKIRDPAVGSASLISIFEDFEGYEVKDDRTIALTYKEPFAGRLETFAFPLVPAHIFGQSEDFVGNPASRQPIGNGPYRLVDWKPGESLTLERSETYWGPAGNFDRIVFKVLTDESVRLNALKLQEVDEGRLSSIQWRDNKDDADFLAKNRILLHYSMVSPNLIVWNNASPLFSDARVRRAMTMLLPREKIIENLYFGTGKLATGMIPLGSWARNETLEPLAWDPMAAREELEQAGWMDSDDDGILDKDGRPFSFTIQIGAGSVISEQMVTLLQNELKRIGGEMEIRMVEVAALNQAMFKGEFEAATTALNLTPDPHSFLHPLFHSTDGGFNFFKYANSQVDELIDAAAVEFDQAKRAKLYHQIEEILNHDQPVTFTIHPAEKLAINKRFRGLSMSPMGLWQHHPGVEDWWIPEADRIH